MGATDGNVRVNIQAQALVRAVLGIASVRGVIVIHLNAAGDFQLLVDCIVNVIAAKRLQAFSVFIDVELTELNFTALAASMVADAAPATANRPP